MTSSGHAFEPPSVEELQAALPQFDVEKMIACGGMGAVYKARQTELDRTVAIKVLPEEFAKDFLLAERFKREAQALAKLQHPGIVEVYKFGEAVLGKGADQATLPYIVMEFVDGIDLESVLRNTGVDHPRALTIAAQVCEALQFAHDHRIVHRDIKPANILLGENGAVKVADFGIAKLLNRNRDETNLTMTNMAVGTADYVAPEQLDGKDDVDERADVFSLGVLVYRMLTGRLPHGASRPPSETNPETDPRLDPVVMRAMRPEPVERYAEAKDMLAELEGIIRAGPAAGAGKTWAKRGWWMGGLAGVLGAWALITWGNSKAPTTEVDRLPDIPSDVADDSILDVMSEAVASEDWKRAVEIGWKWVDARPYNGGSYKKLSILLAKDSDKEGLRKLGLRLCDGYERLSTEGGLGMQDTLKVLLILPGVFEISELPISHEDLKRRTPSRVQGTRVGWTLATYALAALRAGNPARALEFTSLESRNQDLRCDAEVALLAISSLASRQLQWTDEAHAHLDAAKALMEQVVAERREDPTLFKHLFAEVLFREAETAAGVVRQVED